jgi:polyhydroxyalkanoate synthesis regulator phasin
MRLFEIKNTQPRWQRLNEADEKATHLEHLEDEIFNKGYVGALEAFNYIEGLKRMLSKEGVGDSTRVTVKWDGSPAIHCGVDPEDSKFFIGTKSVFSKNAKLCKTNKDIDNWYGDVPELAATLKACLQYLPKLGITDVIKGDLLFVRGTARDLVEQEINGKKYLTFTPNTITYAVDLETQSDLARQMQAAKMGIVFHTVYHWTPPSAADQEERSEEGKEPLKDYPNLPDMKAHFRFNPSSLQHIRDVWWDDAYYEDMTGIATLTPSEVKRVESQLNRVAVIFSKIDPAVFDKFLGTGNAKTSDFVTYIKPFINTKVQQGQMQVSSAIEFLKEFQDYVEQKMQAEISKLKGGAESTAAQARLERVEEIKKFIADNSNTLLSILALYKKAVELKLFFIKKLQMIESTVGTFIKTEDGYKVTKPEGFVAVGGDGQVVKLIDRLEFSRANFQQSKNRNSA